jgi:hypothetical protein
VDAIAISEFEPDDSSAYYLAADRVALREPDTDSDRNVRRTNLARRARRHAYSDVSPCRGTHL